MTVSERSLSDRVAGNANGIVEQHLDHFQFSQDERNWAALLERLPGALCRESSL
jgi:hypothetical protein